MSSSESRPTSSPGFFEVRHGSAWYTGDSHFDYPLGYQDAAAVVNEGGVFVGIVCDGCSTTTDAMTRNQVGAVLGAEFLAHRLHDHFRLNISGKSISFPRALRDTGTACLRFLEFLLRALHNGSRAFDASEFTERQLLFTVLGLVIVQDRYCFCGCGDGCYGINTATKRLDGAEYFVSRCRQDRQSGGLTIYDTGVVTGSDVLWIGTDGLLNVFDREGGPRAFADFLHDDLTCSVSEDGTDHTIRAFRQVPRRHRGVFTDDATVVVTKIRCINRSGMTPCLAKLQ